MLQQTDTYNHHFSYSYTQHERNEFHTGELTGPARSTFFCWPQFYYSEIGLVFSNIRLTQYQSHLISGTKVVLPNMFMFMLHENIQGHGHKHGHGHGYGHRHEHQAPHTHWQTLPLLHISDCSCQCVKDFARNEISRNSAPRNFPGATCSTQDPRSRLIK